jgi:hypothetical protein
MTPPRTPPTPSTAVSQPTPALPRWSRLSGMTTISTVNAPRPRFFAANSSATRRSSGSEPIAAQPRSSARTTRPTILASDARGRAATLLVSGSPASATAAHAKHTAAVASTAVAPETLKRTAASSGPAVWAAAWTTLDAIPAVVSSLGAATRSGRSARRGGLETAVPTVNTAASAKSASRGAPEALRTAAAAATAVRPKSTASASRSRRKRLPAAPRMGARIAVGRSCTATRKATPVAPAER